MEKIVLRITDGFSKGVLSILMLVLMLAITHSILGFIYMIVTQLGDSPHIFHEVNKSLIHEAYAAFLLVLIGLELISSTKIYLQKNVVHAEAVIMVAIIALARHVIDVDFEEYAPLTIIGIGVLIIALAGAYYMFVKTRVIPGGNHE